MWLAKIDVPKQRIFAFQKLLDTHLKWITANGRIEFEGKYYEDVALEDATWFDVCSEIKQIARELR